MTKSKKTRPKRSTNMSGGLLKELQATIAFACYDSPALFKRGTSLSEAQIEIVMASIFSHDDKNGADPDMLTYVDQCLMGLNKFKGLFTQAMQPSGDMLLSIPESLHRHKKLLVYVGDGSIEKAILSQKSVNGTAEKISGRTLLRNAKTVMCNCKKMMAIVKAKGSPYREGAFPSGTNWEDYILWCLVEMGKECDREEAAKIEKVAAAAAAAAAAETAATPEAAATPTMNDRVEEEGVVVVSDPLPGEMDSYPDASFFKCGVGFLAWALWGHIPIHDSAGMKTEFFDETKKKASFGRKTESRAQMRKLLLDKTAVAVDNRRGKKRRTSSDEEDQTVPTPPSLDSKAILAKTLAYLSADSLEKERKKNAQFMIRNVRDKLTSRRRNEDMLLQELDRSYKSKRKPDQALLDRQSALVNEIAALEKNLDELQSDEYRRHSDMIKQRSLELVAVDEVSTVRSLEIQASSSFDDSITIESSADSSLQDVSDDVPSVEVPQQVATSDRNENGCVECGTPSKHLCRKCKKCVCSLCCGQRELENVWWCGTCFDSQTVADQKLIRDGDYCSDSEE